MRVTGRQQRLGEIEEHAGAFRRLIVQAIKRAPEQIGCRREILACECTAARRREACCGTLPQFSPVCVQRTELPAVLVRLLEVERDDLLLLADQVAGLRLQPLGEALVQLGTRLLQHRSVRSVADQHVVKAEDRFVDPVGAVGLDHLLAPQRLQVPIDGATDRIRAEVGDCAAVELLADHGRALHDRALVAAEALEARGDQRVDRRWHLDVEAVARDDPGVAVAREHTLVDEHAHGLGDEQRIALGGAQHTLGERVRQIDLAEQLIDQRAAVGGAERIELDHVDRPAATRQRLTQLAQLRASERDQQQRSVTDPFDEMLDEIQVGRLAPVDVVEHEHQRLLAGECLEDTADAPERLFGRCGGNGAEHAERALDDDVAIAVGRHQARELVARLRRRITFTDPRRRTQHLGDGREGDAAIGRLAAAFEDRRFTRDRPREFVRDPRLADAGGSDHGDERARPRRDDAVECGSQAGELVVPTDERGLGGCALARLGAECDEPERRDRLGLALQVQRRHRLELHVAAYEPLGLLADEHLAVTGRLFEPRRHVDRITDQIAVVAADDHLAGVDAGAQSQLHAPVPLQLLVEHRETGNQLACRAHTSQRVVLTHDRRTERRHHAVTGELDDLSVVRLDRRPRRVVEARHHAPDRLGVERLLQARGPDEVREQDRHGLAQLTPTRRLGDRLGRSAAGVAEARSGNQLVPARTATLSKR